MLTQTIIDKFHYLDDFLLKSHPEFPFLSTKEKAILLRLFCGNTVKEIAYTLNLSEKAVYTYKERGLLKLGFTRNSLIKFISFIYDLFDENLKK